MGSRPWGCDEGIEKGRSPKSILDEYCTNKTQECGKTAFLGFVFQMKAKALLAPSMSIHFSSSTTVRQQ